MGRIYLVADAEEIARRRKQVPPGPLIEVWQDLYVRGQFWMGEETKGYLDSAGSPLRHILAVDAAAVSIYYGPRLRDIESLPGEESLRARILSAHGIAAAWITFDQFGERTRYEPTSPADPIFYLRRPQGSVAHLWRLFREKREAIVYLEEYYGKDPEAREWADALPVQSYEELLKRYGQNS